MALKHAFVSGKADGGDLTQIQPSNWNDNHVTGAWSAYTPTVTAAVGTFTTVSAAGAYLQIDKVVTFRATITVTTVGTASARMIVTVPVTSLGVNTGMVTGFNGATSKGLCGVMGYDLSGSATLVYADGTFPAASGQTIYIGGTYEAT